MADMVQYERGGEGAAVVVLMERSLVGAYGSRGLVDDSSRSFPERRAVRVGVEKCLSGQLAGPGHHHITTGIGCYSMLAT